jgi:hypothetical protein
MNVRETYNFTHTDATIKFSFILFLGKKKALHFNRKKNAIKKHNFRSFVLQFFTHFELMIRYRNDKIIKIIKFSK